jgi:peptidoglycan/LPS O-acetylase OafA/YrhL
VLYHFQTNVVMPAEVTPFLAFGRGGVDLFFMLSGFILAYVYRPQFEARRFNYLRFLVKRIARIYPVHVVTMLIVLAWILLTANGGSYFASLAQDAAMNLMMVHAWGTVDGLTLNYPSWSISAEWFAYLIFPPFMLVLARKRWPMLTLLGACAVLGLGYWALGQIGRPLLEQTGPGALVRIFLEFSTGVALFAASDRNPKFALAITVGFFLVALTASLTGLVDAGLPIIAAMPVAICALYGAPLLLSHPLLVYGGRISYSLYMVHALVQMIFFGTIENLFGYEQGEAPVGWLLPAVAACLGGAALLYHLVEEPARQRISAIGARPMRAQTS